MGIESLLSAIKEINQVFASTFFSLKNSKGTISGLNPNNRTTPANTTTAATTVTPTTTQPKPEPPKLETPKPEIPKTEPSKPKDLPVPTVKNTVINLSGKPSLPPTGGDKVAPVTKTSEPAAIKVQEKPRVETAPVKPIRGESAPLVHEATTEKAVATKEEPKIQEKAKSDKADNEKLEIEGTVLKWGVQSLK